MRALETVAIHVPPPSGPNRRHELREIPDQVLDTVGHGGTVAHILVALAAVTLLIFAAATWYSFRHPKASTPSTVVIAAVRAGALLATFAALAMVSHRAVAGTATDHHVLHWFVHHRSEWLTGPAIAITDAGSPVATIVLAFVIAGVLWWRRRTAIAPLIVIATLGLAGAASTIMKVVVRSERPPLALQLITETDPSFPSGHVTGTLALAGIVAVAIGTGRSPAVRRSLYWGVAAVTVVVAVTRLYLGVHWVTDVVGGALLGGSALILGSCALRLLDRGTIGEAQPVHIAGEQRLVQKAAIDH